MATREASSPAEDPSRPRDPLPGLVSLIKLGRGEFTLGTVQYEDSGQREAIIARLHSALPEWSLVRVSLQDPSLRLDALPVAFFDRLERAAHRRAKGRYDGVLLVDWEKRLVPGPAARQPRTSLTSLFKIGREIVAEKLQCPLIVFLPNWAMALVQEMAADFVSWRSGVFLFPFDPEAIRRDLSETSEAVRNEREARPELLRLRLESSLAGARMLEDDSSLRKLYPEALSQLAELCHRLAEPTAECLHWEHLKRWAARHEARPWLRRSQRRLRKARRLERERIGQPSEDWGKIFRGASAMTTEDLLSGREEDLDRILDMVIKSTFRCGTVWGETGCGKSSLARAGLEVVLSGPRRQVVYVNRYDRLADELRHAVVKKVGLDHPHSTLLETLRAATAKCGDLFILCDQFERIYRLAKSEEEIEAFLRELNRCFEDLIIPVHFIFLLRAEHLWRLLADFDRLAAVNHPVDIKSRYELGWLHRRDAERVLAGLGEEAQAGWPEELVTKVIADLQGRRKEQVKPVEIQLVAAALYLREIRTLSEYENAGGGAGLLNDYLHAVIDDLGEPDLARRVVRQLVHPGRPPLLGLRSPLEIAKELGRKRADVERVLGGLEARNIVHGAGEGPARRFELVHDVLCEPCWRAASPQEMGLSVLRSALRQRQRWLGPRGFWRAWRCDLAELPPERQEDAERLLRRTKVVSFLQALLAMLFLTLLPVTVIQFSTAHPLIESEAPQAVRVYRGLRILHFLPPPLAGTVLYDTGLIDGEVPPNQRNHLLGITLWRWNGAGDKHIERLHQHLSQLVSARRLCSLGHWDDGLRFLLEDMGRQPLPGGSGRDLGAVFAAGASEQVIPPLLPLLKDPDPSLRLGAARSLGAIRYSAADVVVSGLLPLLNDPDAAVRFAAADTLGQIGSPDAARVVPQLKRLLRDPHPDVRFAAADTLGQIGSAQDVTIVSALVPLLKDPDSSVRIGAARALGRLDPSQPGALIGQLLSLLNDPDSGVRVAAARVLGQIGSSRAETVVPKLVPLLKDPDSGVRSATATALAEMVSFGQEAVVSDLFRLLNDTDSLVRFAAAMALRRLDTPEAAETIPKLVPLLKDSEPDVRYAAALTLRIIGPLQAENMISELIPLLKDPESRVRLETVFALGATGSAHAEVLIPELLLLVNDPNKDIRLATVNALAAIGLPQVYRELLPLLEDPDPALREATVSALGAVGSPEAEMLIPEILSLLQDPNSSVRQTAASVLGGLGQFDTEAVAPELRNLLQDNNYSVRLAAARALGEVGSTRVDTVVAEILPLLEDPDSAVREATVGALRGIAENRPLPESAEVQLLRCQRDPEGNVREQVTLALGLHRLQIAKVDDGSPVHQRLISELRGDKSRLDGRYREAIIYALARWWAAGQQDDASSGLWANPDWRERAAKEHNAFGAELARLRELERPWWLRVAAWDVLIEAHRLRNEPWPEP